MKVALPSPSGNVILNLDDPRDHISRVIIRGRTWYEQDLLKDLKRRVGPGVAIDVGAHIGNHTLFMAAHGFSVAAFEPNPASYSKLSLNVKLNPKLSDRVTLYQTAVGRDFNTGTVFSPNPTNSGMAYVQPSEPDEVPDNSYVQIIPLDTLHFTDIQVIKIDVEGHEIDVLEGARGILERDHPVLYIEASTAEARQRVDDFVAPYGYEMKGRFGKTDTWCYQVAAPSRSLSIALMAHPKREEMTLRLQGELAAQGLEPLIVWDQINDRWDTGRRSLLEFHPDRSHHLVLQDDAVITGNFLELVDRALAVPPPDSPLVLYTGKALHRRLKGTGRRYSWLTMPGINWGVGLVFPTHLVQEMVEFCDQRNEGNYDMRCGRFFQSKGIVCWYPQPSLVNHRHTPSLVEGRGATRKAFSWVGPHGNGFNPDGAVLELSWSR